ncbi:tumor necrosis factor receptor superfamily member 19 isoform X1 [Erythrolamprus reginae]|uniref:tumor necrosis factor receptor superfamily member 19 isoform X1 n=2 Tax=Erythrolamprus reginae TaxID=121349 RepID=UPI00396C8D0A
MVYFFLKGKMHAQKFERQYFIFRLLILLIYVLDVIIGETGECREQEYRDHDGNCILCEQCGPGMELSKECGFGYGEDAQCMTCRPNRFKEDWGFQKCKQCLDCASVNRFQKSNCSAISNAVCGDCLPGFYRKTKLGGFQDMECIPCGDPPPPYEPHCTTKVNLVKIPSTVSSPRDTALAAVICSALATVLSALFILCVIYCKRQFMEKKPNWSAQSQDVHYEGSELACFDRSQLNIYEHRTCCQGQQDSLQMCGPVHLIPSLCCDESCSFEHSCHSCPFHSQTTFHERNSNSVGEMIPAFLGSLSHSTCGDLSDAWPLIKKPECCDSISFSESYPELVGEDENLFSPLEIERDTMDSDNKQDLNVVMSTNPHFGSLTKSLELSSITAPLNEVLAAEPFSVTEYDRTN